MRVLTVKRKKSFVSSQMFYWVILKYVIDELPALENREHQINKLGYANAPDSFNPNDYGTPIANGLKITFAIDDTVRSFFAVTADGLISNVIDLDPGMDHIEVTMITKGGWKIPGYPYLILDHENKQDHG
jgi:hypothetical protein